MKEKKFLKKRIKVFHLMSCPGIGGIETMMSNLLPRFDPERIEAAAVNMRSESRCYELWDKKGVRYYKLPTPGKLLLGSIPGLVKFLRREKPDVLEIYGSRAEIIGRIAAVIAGVPVVLTGTLDTHEWRRWYHILLDRLTRWPVKGWLVNAEACRRRLITVEKHPPDLVTLMYDGIDTRAWTRSGDKGVREKIRRDFGCKDDTILCVTVANLREQKGHIYLIEAIPAILKINPRMRFVFVGSDFFNGRLQKKCEELGISDFVVFAGFRADIFNIYEAADVAVLPSWFEGLPICLIEAMSMELPVVSTTVSGIPELVVNGVTGLLVPSKQVEPLIEALVEIGSSEEKRKAMGKAGRQRVLEKFSLDRMVTELTAYYEQKVYSTQETKYDKK
jgi:glycosyltransferase involved in cell wall biosynthesis